MRRGIGVGFAHVKVRSKLGKKDKLSRFGRAREEYNQTPEKGEQSASQLRHFVRPEKPIGKIYRQAVKVVCNFEAFALLFSRA